MEYFERVGHLQELPLIGGEKAVHDVRRLVFAAQRVLGGEGSYFTDEEAALFDKISRRSATSTGMGRVLDMVACALDICQYRSYDGEPAMKLEPWLARGRPDPTYKCLIEDGVVRSVDMMTYVLDAKSRKEDVAATYVHAVVQGLVDIAADRAIENDADAIGVTGGVSYNHTITKWMETMARERGLGLLVPRELPNGDGCISAGQCAIALRRTSTGN
jgi:hydrogenase maturation protein HypF